MLGAAVRTIFNCVFIKNFPPSAPSANGGAYPLIGLFPHKTFGFAGTPDMTQTGRQSLPISRFLLRKNAWRRFAAARRCRADNPRRRNPPGELLLPLRGNSPSVRLSQLSPFWRKLRPLPCSSSSHCDRSAGSQREPLGKTFPPIRSIGEWGAYPLIGLSNGLYLAVLSLPFGESWGMVQSSPIPKTSDTRRGHVSCGSS